MAKYFPLTRTRTKVIEVPVGDGDRDISYNESFDLSDRLSGNLGPVQTPDTLDINDELVIGSAVLEDTLDISEKLNDITAPQFQESIDISDRLSGTLGPVRAPDSLNVADSLNVGSLVLIDTVGISDNTDVDLSADYLDSFVVTDKLREIIQFRNEEFFVSDGLEDIRLQLYDTTSISDTFAPITGLVFGEMLDFGAVADAMISSDIPDNFTISDRVDFGSLDIPDSLSVSDQRGEASVTNARLWPNTVVSNTGFTNPNNMIDLSEATAAQISATQSGGLVGGNSTTVNGNIQVSCPDINVVPNPSITGVQIQAGWTTTASGGLQSGNSVSVAIEYSLNDGGSWTLLQQVTTTAGTGNPTANISANYAQIQAIRFRAVGSVVSGTTVLVGGANQTFQFRYARVQFNASQIL